LVVEADRECPSHGKAAEAKSELDKDHSSSAAVGFSLVGLWVKAEDRSGAGSKTKAISGTDDPTKRAHIVGCPTVSNQNDVSKIRSSFTKIVDILTVPVDVR
jgi:hypothetical protein